jgi:glycosyltransferase involved in cell wall biosynthesis
VSGMRIAILGTRGIPASYGGFETLAEELSTRLAARGHEVTVYCRRAYAAHPHGHRYRGVRLAVLPTVRHKYLETVVHAGLSALHALPRRFDAILLCNAANALFAGLPRLAGTPVAVNVDGLERRRRKWNALGRGWYRLSEVLSTLLPTAVVTDARTIQRYYERRYGKASTFIPYGADAAAADGTAALDRFGLEKGEYLLYVSRLEPENNAHLVVAAWERVRSPRKLVIVGDAPYARRYIERLRATRDPRIVFTGAVYGPGYRQLQSGAWVYVHATEVGGTHPALVEAMAYGHCVVAADVPENRETLGPHGLFFPLGDPRPLARILQELADRPERVAELRRGVAEHALRHYSWERITDAYEALFLRLAGRREGSGRRRGRRAGGRQQRA